MNNVLELKGYCTGCAACSVICPSKAITMKKNQEGFFSPIVDDKKCVSCGICRKVCCKNNDYKRTPYIRLGALQSNSKDVLKESSSGGIATLLSRHFAESGNYVLGSFFDLKNNAIETKTTNKLDDLDAFKSSKYLQSNFYGGLSEAVKLAKSNKESKFIIFGTPCQINGAVNVCEHFGIKDQFTFADFFCHGVPSYLVWESYLNENKINPEQLTKVSFRNKKYGWQTCFIMNVADNAKEISTPSGKDAFYNAFFDNVFLNKSCYQCPFRKGYSKADIRLGDYWGKRHSNDNEGVSSVVIYTKHGETILKQIDTKSLEAGEDLFDAQSTDDYVEEKYRDLAFKTLSSKQSLSKTINIYRHQFPIKKQLKLKAKKTVFTVLPVKAINKFKTKR